ncbi:MAG: hypothetical protein J6Z35_06350, partial [Lachnospiraceae bacterium]|nr:hypothetical protein [Lachnospiraceae bacterium]
LSICGFPCLCCLPRIFISPSGSMAMLAKPSPVQARLSLFSLFYHLAFRLDGDARQSFARASTAQPFLAILSYFMKIG